MSNLPISIPPDSIHIDDDAWQLVSVDEDYIKDRAVIERFADGNVAYVYRTRPRGLTALLEANKASLDESETQKLRFGGDKAVLGRKVASIPLNEFFSPKNQIAEKIKEGDREHLDWWLNRDEARPFRSFRGKI